MEFPLRVTIQTYSQFCTTACPVESKALPLVRLSWAVGICQVTLLRHKFRHRLLVHYLRAPFAIKRSCYTGNYQIINFTNSKNLLHGKLVSITTILRNDLCLKRFHFDANNCFVEFSKSKSWQRKWKKHKQLYVVFSKMWAPIILKLSHVGFLTYFVKTRGLKTT